MVDFVCADMNTVWLSLALKPVWSAAAGKFGKDLNQEPEGVPETRKSASTHETVVYPGESERSLLKCCTVGPIYRSTFLTSSSYVKEIQQHFEMFLFMLSLTLGGRGHVV